MLRTFRSQNETFHIRSWQPADDLGLRMLIRAHMRRDQGWPPAYARKGDAAAWLARPATIARWVAVHASDGVVGHVGLGPVKPGAGSDAMASALDCGTTDLAEICRTVVHPDSRARGLAGQLTRAALRGAIEGNRFPVATVLNNRGAWLAMMLATGWREVHRAPSEVSDCDLLSLLPPMKFIDAVRARRQEMSGRCRDETGGMHCRFPGPVE